MRSQAPLRVTSFALVLLLLGCDGAIEPARTGAGGQVASSNEGGSPGVGGRTSAVGSNAAVGGIGATGGDTFASPRRDCKAASECVLASVTCCGTCRAPTSSDVIALRSDSIADHQLVVCGSGPTMCPACAAMANPDLIATCENSLCTVEDLTSSALSACSVDSDCAVRSADCCECGASTELYNLVALNNTGRQAYAALVCGAATACPECMPVYPTNPAPTCVDGHCRIDR